jgi:nucleolar protein 58
LFQPGVPCRFDEAVLEVMWGLKNLMDSLVPEEELKLTQEDRLPMSQGLKMFLYRHGFDVKPEMVSSKVVFMYEMKCFVLYCYTIII